MFIRLSWTKKTEQISSQKQIRKHVYSSQLKKTEQISSQKQTLSWKNRNKSAAKNKLGNMSIRLSWTKKTEQISSQKQIRKHVYSTQLKNRLTKEVSMQKTYSIGAKWNKLIHFWHILSAQTETNWYIFDISYRRKVKQTDTFLTYPIGANWKTNWYIFVVWMPYDKFSLG